MKKIIYIGILALITTIGMTSCTEQDVKPRDGGAGADVKDPKG
jgi:hypothetical protein